MILSRQTNRIFQTIGILLLCAAAMMVVSAILYGAWELVLVMLRQASEAVKS